MSTLTLHSALTAAALLVLHVQSSLAIQCYKCDNFYTPGCAPPFNGTGVTVRSDCDLCVAMVAETTLGIIYLRDCSSTLVKLDQYEQYLSEIDSLTARQCRTNLCNDLDPTPPSPVTSKPGHDCLFDPVGANAVGRLRLAQLTVIAAAALVAAAV